MHEFISLHFNTIDSTNTYAKAHAKTFDPKKITCITADEQTAGRGRFQREWKSPKGVNLYATFCFQLPLQTLHLNSLAQLMAASLAALLIKEGLHPKIKWPNDIQLNNKKLSGILCETSFQNGIAQIFLGIGINVNMEPSDLNEIDQPATSLKQETHRSWNRPELLEKLQKQFLHDLSLFKSKGFTPFHSLFENLLAHKGEQIRCFDGKKTWVGICHSLTMDGQLNIYLPDKSMHTITSGDIESSSLR